MKKAFTLILAIALCFLSACGASESNPTQGGEKEVTGQAVTEQAVESQNQQTESAGTEQQDNQKTEPEVIGQSGSTGPESAAAGGGQVSEPEASAAETSEPETEKYPNVAGYPIEKDGIKECKLFFNGQVFEYVNGYTRDDHPDVLYVTVDPILYQSYQLTSGVITGSNANGEELQIKCGFINGKMYLMAIGKPFLNIDGTIYEDLEPQLVEFQEGWEDYCSTTLFLEKMAGACVHISEDRSAAYIEVADPISNEDNDEYDYKTENGGRVIATNKSTGEQKTLEVPAEYLPAPSNSGSSGSGQDNTGNGGSTYNAPKTCTSCGGSGKVSRNVMQRDPVSGVITYTYQMENCPVCGGTGRVR